MATSTVPQELNPSSQAEAQGDALALESEQPTQPAIANGDTISTGALPPSSHTATPPSAVIDAVNGSPSIAPQAGPATSGSNDAQLAATNNTDLEGSNIQMSSLTPTRSHKYPDIKIRPPLKFAIPDLNVHQPPALEWLEGTWSVTHSTLPMWRKAKNVRITYKIIPPASEDGPTCLDDEVCSEPTARTLLPQPKSIKGIDTPDGVGGWVWRGKGLLRIASSHWEVLGWGERDGERWVVTYFEATMFTPAGLDIYSSQKEGISEGLVKDITTALQASESRDMAALVTSSMIEVKIEY